METYTLQQLPPAYRRLSIAYFDNVTNSADIKKELVRSALMEGPEGEEARRRMDFAFVEGDVVSHDSFFHFSILSLSELIREGLGWWKSKKEKGNKGKATPYVRIS